MFINDFILFQGGQSISVRLRTQLKKCSKKITSILNAFNGLQYISDEMKISEKDAFAAESELYFTAVSNCAYRNWRN
jgi:hypothetical protein